MKKSIVVAAMLVCAICAIVYAGTVYEPIRLGGSSSTSYGLMTTQGQDSMLIDVDTFYSDTVDILDGKYVNVLINYDHSGLADSSMNDSVEVIFSIWLAYNGQYPLLYVADTIGDADSAISDSTLRHYFRSDTLLANQLWVRTIVTDSFSVWDSSAVSAGVAITDAFPAAAKNATRTKIYGHAAVMQRSYED